MRKPLLSAIVAAACVVPSLSQAQTSAGPPSHGAPGAPRGGGFGATIRHDPPPPPAPPGQPGTSPGVPIVPPAPPSALDSADIFRADPGTYAPRFDRSSRRNRLYGYGAGFAYLPDAFGYISQPESSAPQLDRYMRQGIVTTGYLRLDVEPETAQVYVDGLYVGIVSDFHRGRALEAGPHRIEIQADGFDPLGVDVQISANDTTLYRGTLTGREQRGELRPAAAPKTFYVIPRCYAGTSRPRPDQLRAGCRIEDLRIIPPVVAPPARP